jgi:hypothetical protein
MQLEVLLDSRKRTTPANLAPDPQMFFFVQTTAPTLAKIRFFSSRPTHQPAAPQPIAKPPVKEEGDMIVDVKDEANASADPPPRVLAKAGEVDEILGFRNTLANLPSGRVGKIRLFKSGKVHLVLGGIEYDVSTGMTCNFLQEALAIDSTHLYQLGDITKRMVCYPIVPDLLSKATSDMEPVIVDD